MPVNVCKFKECKVREENGCKKQTGTELSVRSLHPHAFFWYLLEAVKMASKGDVSPSITLLDSFCSTQGDIFS